MFCATSQVMATLIGHSSSSGASIQSRISPNRERCSEWAIHALSGVSPQATQTPSSAAGPPQGEARAPWGRGAAGDAGLSTLYFLQAVAEATHGGDADRPLLDLLAQAVDVDLDRVVADLFAPLAQALDQLVLADQATGTLQQHLQQRQLARRQLDHLVVDVGHAAGGIEGQWPMLDDGGRGAQPAAAQPPDARFQLLQREGLGHVVVGAEIEALDALLDAVGRRENQHRQRRAARAQLAQHFEAVQLGQAEVEDQQIELVSRESRIGLAAAAHLVPRIAAVARGRKKATGRNLVSSAIRNPISLA